VLAAGVGAYGAALFHLITHAFFKALLFLAAGAIIHSLHTQDMKEMGGLWKKMKAVALVFFVGAVSLMGLPPFSGFWSKDEIVAAAWDTQMIIPFIFAFLGVFLTSLYMTRQCILLFSGKFNGKREPSLVSQKAQNPLWYLAGTSIVVGLLGTPFWNVLGNFITPQSDHGQHHEPNWLLMVFSVFTVFVGIGIVAMFYKKGSKRGSQRARAFMNVFQRAWGINSLAYKVFIPLLRKTSYIMMWIDTHLIDSWIRRLKFISTIVSQWLLMIEQLVIDKIVRGFGGIFYHAFSKVSYQFDINIIDRIVRESAITTKRVGRVNRKVQIGQIQFYLGFMLLVTLTIISIMVLFIFNTQLLPVL